MTEARTLWMAAFVELQAELPHIDKGRQAEIPTKSGGTYSYSYADLPSIIDKVRPSLSKHGFAVAQSVDSHDEGVGITTRLYHSAGHVEEFGPLVLPAGDDARTAGSAITYGRRYALCAALGIAADDDDDGAAMSKRESGTKPRGKASGKNCPSCGEDLEDLRETFAPGGKQPAWRCVNKTCTGGGKKKQGGNWPWASWNPHEFDDSPHARWAKNVLWGLMLQSRNKAVMAAAVPPEIDDVSLGRAFWLEMLAVSGQVEPLTEEAAKAVVEAAEQVCGRLVDDPERPF